MDNLCHTLAGAALAQAGLKRRTPLGAATLVIAANLPDLDALAYLRDPVFALAVRRGWTHGVLAMLVLPPLFAGLMLGWDRLARRPRGLEPARPGPLLLLAALGVWSHPLLDLLNTYGVRLLAPFSDRWFYGDAVFIVDPWLWLLLGGAAGLAAWRERQREPGPTGRPGAASGAGGVGGVAGLGAAALARAGLIAAGAYCAIMAGSGLAARALVRREAAAAGLRFTRAMVGPLPGTPFRREVLLDLGGAYRRGWFRWAPAPHLSLEPGIIPDGLETPAARAAAATPRGAEFLRWSRFPAATVEPGGGDPVVRLRDLRYARDGGRSWAAVEIRVPGQLCAAPFALGTCPPAQ